jgi:hypothetical protein
MSSTITNIDTLCEEFEEMQRIRDDIKDTIFGIEFDIDFDADINKFVIKNVIYSL